MGQRKVGGRAAALGVLALGLAFVTVRGRGRRVDERLFTRVNSGLQGPVLDRLFRSITELGSLWASGAAAAAIAARGRRREAADALAAAATTWVAGQGLKRLFKRLRPYQVEGLEHRLLIDRPAGASWPSSHPAVLLTFVTVAARDLGLGSGARSALTLLAGAVGVSRVYLGVHYPADVAGGLLLGRAVAGAWSASVSPRLVG
ncbi:MAG: phosphatase PAP2 family protein [Actinomycetota bacterium]